MFARTVKALAFLTLLRGNSTNASHGQVNAITLSNPPSLNNNAENVLSLENRLIFEKIDQDIVKHFNPPSRDPAEITAHMIVKLIQLTADGHYDQFIRVAPTFYAYGLAHFDQDITVKNWELFIYNILLKLPDADLEKHGLTKTHLTFLGVNALNLLNFAKAINPNSFTYLSNQFTTLYDASYQPGRISETYDKIKAVTEDEELFSKLIKNVKELKEGMEHAINQASAKKPIKTQEEHASKNQENWWFLRFLQKALMTILTLFVARKSVGWVLRKYFPQPDSAITFNIQIEAARKPKKKRHTTRKTDDEYTPQEGDANHNSSKESSPIKIDSKKLLHDKLISHLEKMQSAQHLKEVEWISLLSGITQINLTRIKAALDATPTYSTNSGNKFEKAYCASLNNFRSRLMDIYQVATILKLENINEEEVKQADALLYELNCAYERSTNTLAELNQFRNKHSMSTQKIHSQLQVVTPQLTPIAAPIPTVQPIIPAQLIATDPLHNSGKLEMTKDETQEDNETEQEKYNQLIHKAIQAQTTLAKACGINNKQEVIENFNVDSMFTPTNPALDMPITQFARAMYAIACHCLKADGTSMSDEMKETFDIKLDDASHVSKLETILDKLKNNTDLSTSILVSFATGIMQYFQDSLPHSQENNDGRRLFARK